MSIAWYADFPLCLGSCSMGAIVGKYLLACLCAVLFPGCQCQLLDVYFSFVLSCRRDWSFWSLLDNVAEPPWEWAVSTTMALGFSTGRISVQPITPYDAKHSYDPCIKRYECQKRFSITFNIFIDYFCYETCRSRRFVKNRLSISHEVQGGLAREPRTKILPHTSLVNGCNACEIEMFQKNGLMIHPVCEKLPHSRRYCSLESPTMLGAFRYMPALNQNYTSIIF